MAIISEPFQIPVNSGWTEQNGLHFCTVRDPVFGLKLTLAIGKCRVFSDFVKNTYGDKVGDDFFACYYGVDHKTDTHTERRNYINLQTEKLNVRALGDFSHELHHFVHYELQRIGVGYKIALEEVFAYVNEFFSKESIRALVALESKLSGSEPILDDSEPPLFD